MKRQDRKAGRGKARQGRVRQEWTGQDGLARLGWSRSGRNGLPRRGLACSESERQDRDGRSGPAREYWTGQVGLGAAGQERYGQSWGRGDSCGALLERNGRNGESGIGLDRQGTERKVRQVPL